MINIQRRKKEKTQISLKGLRDHKDQANRRQSKDQKE